MSNRFNIVASIGVWSPDGVGGSDSYLRRLSKGLTFHGKSVNNVFVEESFSGKLSFIRTLIYMRYNREKIIIYRLLPYDRLVVFLVLLGYKKSAVIIPFEPVSNVRATLYSYLLLSRNKYVVSQNLQRVIKKKTKLKCELLMPSVPSNFLTLDPIHSRKYKMIFVGRIDPRKGFDLALNLFERLSDCCDLEKEMFVIYDLRDPGVEDLLVRAQKSDIKITEVDRNRYTSSLDAELMNWLDECTYFIQPYREIASTVDTPLLLLEAMSRGCTILTTDLVQTEIVCNKCRFKPDQFVMEAERVIRAKELYLQRKELLSEEGVAGELLKNLV